MAPNFRSGIKRAEEAAKASRGRFARATFFSLDDEESAILRFLTEEHPRCGHVIDEDGTKCRQPLWLNEVTDSNECQTHGADVGEEILGWITVDMHTNVKTREEPDGYEGNWPKTLPAVCRKDPAFGHKECYICDEMTNPRAKGKSKKYRPQPRMWALACVREEVREGKKVVGMRDKMRTVKRTIDGKEQEVEEQDIVILNFGWKNFFSHLRGTVEHYGTALDRDYKVTRRGEELDTEYDFVAYDPIDETVEYADGTEGTERFDLRDPYFEAFYETDVVLGDEIARRAEDEFYDMFFDERHPQPYEKGEGSSNTKSGKSNRPKSEKKDREADPDRMKALAARVRGHDDDEPEDDDDEDEIEDENEQTEDDDQVEDEAEQEEKPAPAKAAGATKKVAPRKATASTSKAASNGGAAKAKKAPAKKAAARR